jgi:hypothetical protein
MLGIPMYCFSDDNRVNIPYKVHSPQIHERGDFPPARVTELRKVTQGNRGSATLIQHKKG